MANLYTLSIVTPYGTVFEGQAESLVAPAQDGRFGVLANHAPLVIALKEGILKVSAEGTTQLWSIGQGVLEMNSDNACLILTDSAEPAHASEAAHAS